MSTSLRSTAAGRSFAAWTLLGAAISFWLTWALMPGVGITDAATILTLVGAQPQKVLASFILQLASAGLLALSIPGLANRFTEGWGRVGVGLLAVGACGDAADAVYHQVAFEMVQSGVSRAAMLPVMQRLQTVDLLYVLPLILAFLFGCGALCVGAARAGIVPKWQPWLYMLFVALAAANRPLASIGIAPRATGLACLGLLSFALAWVATALRMKRV